MNSSPLLSPWPASAAQLARARRLAPLSAAAVVLLWALPAKADQPLPEPATPVAALSNFAEGSTRSASRAKVTLGGYVETYYQWNFANPSNGISNLRGFDNRSNSFTLQNAVFDATGALGSVTARLALQFGSQGEAYYAAEPRLPGASGANPSGPDLWKHLQQANLAYTAPLGRGLTLDAGLFLSPIGPEGMAVKDQWNWSRSNLFFGLPFYHAGVRATYPAGQRGTLSAMVSNGWNAVVDQGAAKSVMAQYSYNVAEQITWNVLYFGGVERPQGAPEGQPWRHLLDSYVALYLAPRLAALVHANVGFESGELGRSGWAAGALYLRAQALEKLYLAARGELFREWQGRGAQGKASPIFWGGAAWVASQTLTADVRPADNLSLRLEFRHDQSDAPLFFGGRVQSDAAGYVANRAAQDTLTLGATASF